MLRKIFLVVDCADENEKEAVQNVFNEISNLRAFNGSDVLRMKPAFDRNRNDLFSLFSMIKKGGVKSLFSLQGGMLLKKLTRNG